MDEWNLPHQFSLGDERANSIKNICAILESGQIALSTPSSTFCGNQNLNRFYKPLSGRVSRVQDAVGHTANSASCGCLSRVAASICTSFGEILRLSQLLFPYMHMLFNTDNL